MLAFPAMLASAATLAGQKNALVLLVDHGANLAVRLKDSSSVLDVAKTEGTRDIYFFLWQRRLMTMAGSLLFFAGVVLGTFLLPALAIAGVQCLRRAKRAPGHGT